MANEMKQAKIRLGYDTILVVPGNKLQCILDALALCRVCDTAYPKDVPTLVVKEDEVEIKLGSFPTMTRDEYLALITHPVEV